MPINVNVEAMETLGRVLNPAEIAVYFAVRVLQEQGLEASAARVNKLLPGSSAAWASLRARAGFKGRMTPEGVEALENGLCEALKGSDRAQDEAEERRVRQEAAVVVGRLVERVGAMDDRWFAIQHKGAQAWIRSGTKLEEIEAEIRWIWGPDPYVQTYVAPYCTTIAKLRENWSKFKYRTAGIKRTSGDRELLKESIA